MSPDLHRCATTVVAAYDAMTDEERARIPRDARCAIAELRVLLARNPPT